MEVSRPKITSSLHPHCPLKNYEKDQQNHFFVQELSKMDTPTLLHHRMNKFRHLGGFIEGAPVDPRKKVNMKKKEEAPAAPKEQQHEDLSAKEATSSNKLGDEIEKLKQQILSSTKTDVATSQTPGLSEMIAKLKEEVDQEFAVAAKTMGFVERLETLRKELAKSGSSFPLESGLKEKIRRLRQEFKESLPQCPNFESLNRKLSMLKDAVGAKKASEGNERVSLRKQEVNRALKSVMERPDIREKVEILKAEISDAGVLRSSSQVDPDQKRRIWEVKREVQCHLVKALEALKLTVETVAKAPEGDDKNPYDDRPDHLDIGGEMEELEKEITARIQEAIKSEDLDGKLEMLKMEVSRSGMSPDPEAEERIERMRLQVKQDLAEAVSSSPELVEKFERLGQGIARREGEEETSAVEATKNIF